MQRLRSRWCLLLSLMLIPIVGASQATAQAPEADAVAIEAAMLRNFARYVSWPAAVFTSEKAPWQICILGNDPFESVLDRTVLGRQEQGRSFSVRRATDASDVASCQIVFVAMTQTQKRRAALAAWKDLPILTVSDTPGFLQEGGTIRFDVGDRVEVSVNLDRARALGLKIQTKLLEVAREVLDNGSVRRRR